MSNWKTQLPMWATYSRIVGAPLIVVAIGLPETYAGWLAAFLFVVFSLTDWLDGYWARKYNCESAMGQFMDPIADKILVLGALVPLLAMGRVDVWMVFIFLTRDIFIGGLRSVAASNQVIISAKPFGKWKTAFQMVAIPCALIHESVWGLPLAEIGYYGLWLSVLLSMISAFEYTYGYYRGRKI